MSVHLHKMDLIYNAIHATLAAAELSITEL